MTRQELIDKLYAWYVEWLNKSSIDGQTNEYYQHRGKENKILAKDKMRRLKCMTDDKLKEMFVMELIRRESNGYE